MRLLQLLDGSTTSEFILIHDDKEAKGGLLVNEFVKQNVKSQNNVHLLSLEKNPIIFKNSPRGSNFKQYCFSDYSKWLYSKRSEQSPEEHQNPLKVLKDIQKNQKPESKTVIVIDSLSLFVLLYPDVSYKIIHNLVNQLETSGKYQQQVICLLHTDVLPGGKQTLMMFEQLATTNVIVSQDKNKSIVTTNHRKASGRIIQTVEQFCFDVTTGLISTKQFEKPTENITQNDDDNIANISNDVTFKLGLEDGEKRARSELVLPYLKTTTKPGSGEIVYEPDANDDWDEEDPDDDLNI
uniref:Elongator complex protein 5 n=1 Tax=Graphocephala atropunctata TaxID=36148 RepID=A0A1B6LH71_9HEMI